MEGITLSVMGKRQTVRSVRFRDEEYAMLQERAAASGMTFGQYVRHHALRAGVDQADKGTTPAPAAPAPTRTMQRNRLDDLGDDPLRGGMRSARR